MPRLSILVPLSGAVASFETTLASVLQNRPKDCDVLVAHPESYDDPWSLSNEVQFLEAPEDTPLLEMLDACLPYVRGDVLHILQGGLEATEGWTDAAVAAFRDPRVATVSPLVVNREQPTEAVSVGLSYSRGGQRLNVGAGLGLKAASSTSILGPALRAGFYRTELLLQLGGWEAAIGEQWADIDLALTLDAAGLTSRCVGDSVVIGHPEEPLARGIAAGRAAERVFWRHAVHRGWISSVLAHPFTVAADALGALPSFAAATQLLGRTLALADGARYAEYRKDLRRWLEQLDAANAATAAPAPPGDAPAPPQIHPEPARRRHAA
ncbi:MAG: glycosyltransferase family 2 protein [Pirellulales bacterium]